MPIAPLTLDATARSPAVTLDPAKGTLTLSGESYPEDASAFFGPIFQAVEAYLEASPSAPFTVEMRLIYFNSSSAKALMNLFQMLEEAAQDAHAVTVNWYFDPDDDMMEEMGEDFSEDFEHAQFHLKPEATAA